MCYTADLYLHRDTLPRERFVHRFVVELHRRNLADVQWRKLRTNQQGFKLTALCNHFHNQSSKPGGAFKLGSSLRRLADVDEPLGGNAELRADARDAFDYIHAHHDVGVQVDI